MCDKDVVIEDESGQEMTEEQLLEVLSGITADKQESKLEFAFEPIEMDEELLIQTSNTKEYIEGESVGAFYSGIYTTLVNHGFDIESASTICINEQTMRHNIKVAEINKAMNIEMAKHGAIQAEKSQL